MCVSMAGLVPMMMRSATLFQRHAVTERAKLSTRCQQATQCVYTSLWVRFSPTGCSCAGRAAEGRLKEAHNRNRCAPLGPTGKPACHLPEPQVTLPMAQCCVGGLHACYLVTQHLPVCAVWPVLLNIGLSKQELVRCQLRRERPRQVLLTVHADGSLVAGVVAPAARTLSTLWSVSATGGPRGPAAQARPCITPCSCFGRVGRTWVCVLLQGRRTDRQNNRIQEATLEDFQAASAWVTGYRICFRVQGRGC